MSQLKTAIKQARSADVILAEQAEASFDAGLYRRGDAVPGKGIYMGAWYPDHGIIGEKLGKVFHVFAAPEDLTGKAGTVAGEQLLRYREAVEEVSIKRWHGHQGSVRVVSEKSLYEAIRSGKYQGEWIIPPLALVAGDSFVPYGLYNLKDTGAFKGSLIVTPGASYYWTSTRASGTTSVMMAVRMASGLSSPVSDTEKCRCRPVRLEETKPRSLQP